LTVLIGEHGEAPPFVELDGAAQGSDVLRGPSASETWTDGPAKRESF
jgi:hypothetical protein